MWLMNMEGMQGGGADQDHVLPLPSLRQKLSSSESVIMVEATDALQSCGVPGATGFEPRETAKGAQVAWELRTYQLVLGYPTVPRFLELYAGGLSDKLAADDSGASQLATLLYSDCGSLNVVMELWRHESMQRAQQRLPCTCHAVLAGQGRFLRASSWASASWARRPTSMARTAKRQLYKPRTEAFQQGPHLLGYACYTY